jgi:hypothetical protein
MGFFSKIVGSAVKVAVTPFAVVGDAVKAATGQEANNTKNLLDSAAEDFAEAFDDLVDGEVL